MRKVLISVVLLASTFLAGCGRYSLGDTIVSGLDRLPFIYRPIIQQGNVVSQEAINNLHPGMSKRQVQFILGTPMLTDVFHHDRWDYVFTRGKGSVPTEFQRVAVFFEDDRLSRIEGDLRPQPKEARKPAKKEVIVSVPDWEGEDRTWLERQLSHIGL